MTSLARRESAAMEIAAVADLGRATRLASTVTEPDTLGVLMRE